VTSNLQPSTCNLEMRTLRDSVRAGQAMIREQNEDARRGEFLRALDASEEVLYQFEESFVSGFVKDRHGKEPSLDFQWFTPRRRSVVDHMIKRYGLRTLKPVPRVRELPDATPGLCGYFVRDQEKGLNQRCNRPATLKIGDLELCDDCQREREQMLARVRKLRTRF
jgi:hypothetical protein